ncbi:MAG: group II intron reverse transcriptase domain-containing protein [Lachnospiraceae bacterium]|nr:group II intron reverse transcriptase domain-containing protein [Lachnospiraceae bacterium]
MSLLERLSQESAWDSFYEYKTHLTCPKDLARELEAFIAARAYLPVCERIQEGQDFPLPRKAEISKMGSSKKRTVYIYPKEENTVLKLLTYLLLREYDGLFAPNLYSFRPQRTAKDAVRTLSRIRGIRQMYVYKVDISNYFNSIPLGRFLPVLEETLAADPELLAFLKKLLQETRVITAEGIWEEEKGIMAGTPLSAFYANLYLKDLDQWFYDQHIPYARYSDDIIVFGKSREAAERAADRIRDVLKEKGLKVNPKKESFSSPEEGWTFLGFACRDGVIDIAPATLTKLKGKMRRKARALLRWRKRNGIEGEKAAAAFIRIFNRKLLESPDENELSWSYWFFSVINTTESLNVIDRYAQECLRYLISGTRTKARYNIRYEDLKKLGYRSLVHEYYSFQA